MGSLLFMGNPYQHAPAVSIVRTDTCLAGTVWQWCWDWYGSYSSSSQTDPRGPTSGSLRVNRGGGWGYYAYLCRAASRDYGNPAISGYYGGFRSVLPAGQ